MEQLKAAILSRKTHKKSIERDILIIDLYYNTGLRLSELTNLRVTDLRLTGKMPYLKVLQGKGGKDRDVNLNPYICGRLKSFTRGMSPEARGHWNRTQNHWKPFHQLGQEGRRTTITPP